VDKIVSGLESHRPVVFVPQQRVIPKNDIAPGLQSQLAAGHARPDTPQWLDCTFDDDVAYVRSRTTGELSAFVAVTIASEHSGDSTSGTSDAVGNLQAGTAVFRFDHDHWETDGHAILNLSPTEAVQHFRNDFEIVAEEIANRV